MSHHLSLPTASRELVEVHRTVRELDSCLEGQQSLVLKQLGALEEEQQVYVRQLLFAREQSQLFHQTHQPLLQQRQEEIARLTQQVASTRLDQSKTARELSLLQQAQEGINRDCYKTRQRRGRSDQHELIRLMVNPYEARQRVDSVHQTIANLWLDPMDAERAAICREIEQSISNEEAILPTPLEQDPSAYLASNRAIDQPSDSLLARDETLPIARMVEDTVEQLSALLDRCSLEIESLETTNASLQRAWEAATQHYEALTRRNSSLSDRQERDLETLSSFLTSAQRETASLREQCDPSRSSLQASRNEAQGHISAKEEVEENKRRYHEAQREHHRRLDTDMDYRREYEAKMFALEHRSRD